ncbi:MAG TPA: gliding motility-associated C-terminal domain-containing protein, partial [Bacteroidetes bacterium]|nr:gliding motility-associated C-terminal domain-containing protein [Bacteroidota bacterium]
CSLSADSITEGDCNNNSTPSDNTDDSFDVNFTVSAQNGSASGTYVVTQGNDSLGVFEYNKEQKITLSADGNTYTLRFKDSDSGDCFVEREVSQNSCSDECALTLESVSIGDCNDNSTPSDNTDDSFDVNFTLSAQNGSTSGTYSVTQGNDSLGVFEYNKEQKVTLPADGNTYTLIFKDSDSGDCFVEKEVSQNSCSDECALTLESVSIGDCNDNSTPSDNTDDSFEVSFTVSAQNSSAGGTYVVTQGNDTLGVFEYNKEQKITLPADGNTYTLIFKDIDSGDCFVEREVSQNSCSDECALTLDSVSIGDCNDNSTPSDNTDDSFDVSFTVSAQNSSAGGTYVVTQGNDTLGVFEYNKEQKISLPADGNTYTLIFKDSDSGDCFVEKEVSQNSCSDEIITDTTSIYVPNIFSPDGDGINDIWYITFINFKPTIVEAVIFDRWGEKVAKWHDVPNVNWDGTFNGKKVNPGVFVYYIIYKKIDGKEVLLMGDITVVR